MHTTLEEGFADLPFGTRTYRVHLSLPKARGLSQFSLKRRAQDLLSRRRRKKHDYFVIAERLSIITKELYRFERGFHGAPEG